MIENKQRSKHIDTKLLTLILHRTRSQKIMENGWVVFIFVPFESDGILAGSAFKSLELRNLKKDFLGLKTTPTR